MPNDMRDRPRARPGLQVDVEEYQAMLDDPRYSDAEKIEFLEAMWQFIVACVDLGFGVHPVQQVCGQADDFYKKSSTGSQDMLDWLDNIQQRFEDAARGTAEDESHETST